MVCLVYIVKESKPTKNSSTELLEVGKGNVGSEALLQEVYQH